MGGKLHDRAQAISGRLVLIPYPRPDDLALAQLLSRGYIADNGAYSDWRAGHPTFRNYPGYVAWVEKLQQDPKFHWAVIRSGLKARGFAPAFPRASEGRRCFGPDYKRPQPRNVSSAVYVGI